jgi:hypothetical protein
MKNQLLDDMPQAYSSSSSSRKVDPHKTIKESDIFLHFSTVLGYVSFGDSTGSWFIKAWSAVMQGNSSCDLHHQALLVNNETSHHTGLTREGKVARMMPYIEHSLRKKLYLQKNNRNHQDGRHEGNCLNNKKHGKGTFYWVNGARYDGDLLKGQRTGAGTYYYANEVKYKGDWVDGNKHGKGTYYEADGDRYEGESIYIIF